MFRNRCQIVEACLPTGEAAWSSTCRKEKGLVTKAEGRASLITLRLCSRTSRSWPHHRPGKSIPNVILRNHHATRRYSYDGPQSVSGSTSIFPATHFLEDCPCESAIRTKATLLALATRAQPISKTLTVQRPVRTSPKTVQVKRARRPRMLRQNPNPRRRPRQLATFRDLASRRPKA